jgi:hypothetical protein
MHYIEHPHVSRLGELRAAKIAQVRKPEDVESMIDSDNDHVAALAQVRPVIPG